MEIRNIKNTEMKEALDLVWRVFLEFEAPDYTEEGIKEFRYTYCFIFCWWHVTWAGNRQKTI